MEGVFNSLNLSKPWNSVMIKRALVHFQTRPSNRVLKRNTTFKSLFHLSKDVDIWLTLLTKTKDGRISK